MFKVTNCDFKRNIQKSIDTLNENFVSDKDFKNFVIYKGQKFEADAAYIDIYQQATASIYVVDDYVNTKTLQLLSQKKTGVEVILFTQNGHGRNGFLTTAVVNDFVNQYPPLHIKSNPACHDRLIAFHRAEEFKHAYHYYTSLSGLKGILDSSEFYLTEYHYLNDMEEFEYVDRLLWEVLEEELSVSPKWDIIKAAVEKQLHVCRTQTLKPEESFYVLSFSQQRDNLTLWAEFASFGCNFKVNPYSIFEGSVLEHSVIYDKEEQLELVRSCIRDSLENFYEYVDVEHPLPLAQLLDVFNVEIMA